MPRPRRLAAVLGAAALLGATLLLSGAAGPASAASTALVADRTTDLVNGQAVTLTATGRKPLSTVLVLQCREGSYPLGADLTKPIAYGGHQVQRWQADCNPDPPGPKIDNSGRTQLGVTDPRGRLTVVTYVHEGTAMEADRPDVTQQQVHVSIPCDPTHPCTLVVVAAGYYTTVQSFPITFAPSASTACGAPTDSSASGAGPFSITPTYQRWATSSCATGTASPLLLDYTDTGEAAGLTAFAQSQSDLAISATGFSSDGGSDVENSRPAVFTPLAAEAAVIAFDGSSVLQDPVSYQFGAVPITDLSLTLPEVASLFSSPFGTSAEKSPALVARNPQLAPLTAAFGKQATLVAPDGVLATPDSTVLAMTRAWAALPDSAWTRGVLRGFPSSLGTGTADTSSIPLLSSLSALTNRVLGSLYTAPATPAHQVFLYLTDSATAAQLGLQVAKIQNASGAFVAPTAASVAAGVAAMTPGPDGVLVPDAGASDKAAYPLPLVQYAVTPHEQFAHSAQVTQFLTYATTKGQGTDLAPGVFPLPAALATAAASSLPLIGSAAPAGTPTAALPGPVATPSRSGSLPKTPALPSLPSVPRTGSVAPVPAVVPTTGASSAAPATPAPVAIPSFTVAARSPMQGLAPAAGVAVLALLLFAAAYVTSGRPSPAGVPAAARVALVRARSLLRRRTRG